MGSIDGVGDLDESKLLELVEYETHGGASSAAAGADLIVVAGEGIVIGIIDHITGFLGEGAEVGVGGGPAVDPWRCGAWIEVLGKRGEPPEKKTARRGSSHF